MGVIDEEYSYRRPSFDREDAFLAGLDPVTSDREASPESAEGPSSSFFPDIFGAGECKVYSIFILNLNLILKRLIL